MVRITSRHNPIVARFRAAARGDTPEVMLLDGIHLISEALAAGLEVRELAIGNDGLERPEVARLVDAFALTGGTPVAASTSVMAALSPVRSASPAVGLATRPQSPEKTFYKGTPLALAAVDVQDPGNMGAIVRAAEAFGATGVVVAGASADPYGWKALRGSMGSGLRLPILSRRDGIEAAHEAKRHGCRLIATVPRGGTSLFDLAMTGPLAILIGSEGSGLPDDVVRLADARVTIPMHPPVESLNTAVTAALLACEAQRQRSRHADGERDGHSESRP